MSLLRFQGSNQRVEGNLPSVSFGENQIWGVGEWLGVELLVGQVDETVHLLLCISESNLGG